MGPLSRLPTDVKAMTADDFRTLEQSRLQALVERDMPLAWRLHAPDFQLVTPRGHTYSREAYLGEVESGGLSYLEWTPEAIEVHAFAEVAVLRYKARLLMDSGTVQPASFECWHTDSYELRGAVWQVVWSQATAIR